MIFCPIRKIHCPSYVQSKAKRYITSGLILLFYGPKIYCIAKIVNFLLPSIDLYIIVSESLEHTLCYYRSDVHNVCYVMIRSSIKLNVTCFVFRGS